MPSHGPQMSLERGLLLEPAFRTPPQIPEVILHKDKQLDRLITFCLFLKRIFHQIKAVFQVLPSQIEVGSEGRFPAPLKILPENRIPENPSRQSLGHRIPPHMHSSLLKCQYSKKNFHYAAG